MGTLENRLQTIFNNFLCTFFRKGTKLRCDSDSKFLSVFRRVSEIFNLFFVRKHS